MLAEVLATMLTIVVFIIAIIKLRKVKFDSKKITRIGIFTALSIVLYMIKIVPFPQGGGCSLLSILPIMVLSVVGGIEEAIICGIIVGLTKIIIAPPYFPLQIPLDYLGAMMAIGFTSVFGIIEKKQLLVGAVLASLISISFSILSGIIFFGQFAPEGMNVWVYATAYNLMGYGVEVVLSIIVLMILPLKRFKLKEVI